MEGVPAAQERPKDMTWAELRRFVEDVYEFRYAQDVEKLKVEAAERFEPEQAERSNSAIQARPLPQDSAISGQTHEGLAEDGAAVVLDVVRSTEMHRESLVGAEMFGRFLEERYDEKDLLFYLHARTVVQRLTRLDPRSGWSPVGSGLPNKQLHEERHLGAPAPSKAIPAIVDAKLAVQITRECVKQRALQDRVFAERLDPWMVAQGRADIEIDTFLQIITEEYHCSREACESPHEIEDGAQEERALLEAGHEPGIGESPPTHGLGLQQADLCQDPGVQMLADEIGHSMSSKLKAQGVTGLKPQEIAAWSVQMAAKRSRCVGKRRDSFKSHCSSGNSSGYSVTMEVMRKTWKQVYASAGKPRSKGRGIPTGSSTFTQGTPIYGGGGQLTTVDAETPDGTPGDGDDPSPVEELMQAVHSSLESATARLAGEAAKAAMVVAGADIEEEELAQLLTEHLAPIADRLLEALVNNDYEAWLDILGVNEDDAEGPRRQQFESLRTDFLEALSVELTQDVLLRICGLVLSADEFQAMARELAQGLVAGSPTPYTEESVATQGRHEAYGDFDDLVGASPGASEGDLGASDDHATPADGHRGPAALGAFAFDEQ
eukprot:CAMPEP_0176194286 /NCGR_PEP_ID=MMETSP0121_2-20121125/5922_1 /TAXON_ID=160619 /ORGANISM="Kryptoperidinium foliaceum, Strain CCMP 1326" /LENGTH=604 /DNA_ID=CAMNT_0017533027 /DNA_START=1 /DNA_END=1816 /DNA_ORIENTATION=-